MTDTYIHGYTPDERHRLDHQATTLAALLHAGTRYAPGSTVLEAGCGTGAQTAILARSSPGARITAVDRSATSLAVARARIDGERIETVRFLEADLLALPFPPASFDHVFLCFVLEHLPSPAEALARLVALLRPGGTLTAIEGDHGSALFHPNDAAARRVIAAQAALQRRAGGDPMIGRRLGPLLRGAGLATVHVSPRIIYADAGMPDIQEGFVARTFNAMVAGVREQTIAAGLADAADFDAGLAALHRAAGADGTFSYAFFKGVGHAPAGPARQDQ